MQRDRHAHDRGPASAEPPCRPSGPLREFKRNDVLLTTKPIIGWRELVEFPDWGIEGVVAKIDTGARTSAIHVEEIKKLKGNRVKFFVVTRRRTPVRHVPVKADLVRTTRVRSSSGHTQERYVVAARVRIGPVTKRVEMSLVRRGHMLCRMLLGRTALEGFLVDVNQRHVFGAPVRRKKRRPA